MRRLYIAVPARDGKKFDDVVIKVENDVISRLHGTSDLQEFIGQTLRDFELANPDFDRLLSLNLSI